MRTITLLFVLIAVLVLPVQSQAHAILMSSTPKDGSTVKSPPKKIVLNFDAAIEKTVSQVALYLGSQKINLKTPPNGYKAGKKNQLVIPVPALKPGKYSLDYKVLATDGHLTPGRIQFTVAKGKAK